MKAIIEEQLKNNNAETAVLFVEILNCISSSRTEAELRHQMELLQMRHYQCSNTASVQAICGYAKLTEEID